MRIARLGKYTPVLLISALLVLGLAACGGGSDSTSSSSDTSGGGAETGTETEAKEPTGTPIKIGQVAPIATAGLDYSDMQAGAAGAALSINENGGIDGHPVEISFCNEENNANAATACGRKLVGEGVVSIAGSLSVTGEKPIAELAEKEGIAMVGNDNLAGGFGASENEYPLNSYPFSLLGYAPACAKEGLNKMAISGNATGIEAIYEPFIKAQIEDIPGASLVSSGTNIETTATDVTAPVKKLTEAETECIVSIWYPAQTILAMNSLEQFGSSAKAAWSTAAVEPSEVEQFSGVTEKHGIGVGSFPQPSTAEKYESMKEFRADMEAEKASGDSNAPTGDYVRDEAVEAWLSVKAIAAVMEKEKVYDRAGFYKAMKTVKDVEIADFLPPWTPNKPGIAGYAHMPPTTVFSYTFEGATPVPLEVLDIAPFLKYIEASEK